MKWTNEEIRNLEEDFRLGKWPSNLNGRSPNAIRIMASRLGLGLMDKRKLVSLTDYENQVIIGSMMGDMHIRKTKTSKNSRIEEGHGFKQKDYIVWKSKILKNLSFSGRNNTSGYFVQSKNYPCLNYYRELFYSKQIKIITPEILDKIGPVALAFWYMDDGSKHSSGNGCSLHTNGFSLGENIIIKNWLQKNWNISSEIKSHEEPKRYPGRVWHYQYFNGFNTQKFFHIIYKHIHPSMKYKLRGFKVTTLCGKEDKI